LMIPAFNRTKSICTQGITACLLALFCALAVWSRPVSAQESWEYSPYQVQIWLVLPDDPTWRVGNFEQLKQVLLGRAESKFGPSWECVVDQAPDTIAGEVRIALADLKVDQVQSVVPQGFKADKIYLVAIAEDIGSFLVRIRELDYRARQFGMVRELDVPQRDALPWRIWDGIVQAFTPIAKIERVDKMDVTARIKAGGLITEDDSAAWIRTGAALLPVIRRNDRFGEPANNGISRVAWTMLEVLEQDGVQLKCKLHTGYRSPIPSKGTARLERLALLVQPQFPSTRLHLRSRDKQAVPLVGYEVWRKTQGLEGELIGRTDWRGDIELPREEAGQLQTLLIKSGGQLLARLPLVPGQEPRMEAAVVNDDLRVQAEGILQSFQSRIMDLEARRQITAIRMRAKIKERKFDEAQQLLEEFRTIDTREQMKRLLDQQVIRSNDPTTQKRIEKLFVDANTLLFKFLDPNMGIALQTELIQAKAANKGVETSPPAAKAASPSAPPAPTPTAPVAEPAQ
jgi:hypothetical protein